MLQYHLECYHLVSIALTTLLLFGVLFLIYCLIGAAFVVGVPLGTFVGILFLEGGTPLVHLYGLGCIFMCCKIDMVD